MATITVFKFNNPYGAEQMLDKVKDMQKMELIKLQDAAIVTWPQGRKQPKTQQMMNLAGAGALNGAFWGMLCGLIFFVPFFGLAIGAAMGALAGRMVDYGISDDFIKSVRQKVTEGTSALFLLTSGAVMERVKEQLKGMEFELIASNLTKEQENQLRATFSAD